MRFSLKTVPAFQGIFLNKTDATPANYLQLLKYAKTLAACFPQSRHCLGAEHWTVEFFRTFQESRWNGDL